MAYIGKSPAVGNFVKLDAITTSSTNTYNLTVDSVAFVPESANHMLVSLNGVIQAPLSSFSVSGSTITFLPASGTLSSSDSIDFIMVYGNVLDIGTPSDSTVTNAKTNFVSTSSSAGLQIKGDNTTAGTLQLNCEQNSHGIKLRSPSHSASASYTLTFPTTDGSANEFLKTDGSGVLSWASAGGNMTPAFSVYLSGNQTIPDSVTTKIQFNTETLDSDSAFDTSNYDFTVPSGEGGKYFVHLRVYMYGSGNARMFASTFDLKHTPSGGSQTNYTGMRYYENSAELEDGRSGSVSGIISLNAGDKISAYVGVSTNGSSPTAEQSGTHFCGYKIIE
jgi:hypothetical protein|tara:strand:+ start:3307 stop:4308 length:1002 start_codon:yes stop_codon:yes gene_type:complete